MSPRLVGRSAWGRVSLAWAKEPWMVPISGAAGLYLAVTYVYTLGLVMQPLQKEFGWTRFDVSLGSMIVSAIAVFGNPLVGMLLDKLGARRVAIFGVFFYCTAFAMVATASSSLTKWCFLWLVIGIAVLFVNTPVWMSGVASRFNAHRGLAVGVTALGAAFAASTVPAISNVLIERVGWRFMYLALAAVYALIVGSLVIAFFVDANTAARSIAMYNHEEVPTRGVGVQEALLSRDFWRIGIVALFSTASVLAIAVHFVPIVTAGGLTRTVAANIAGLIGLAGFVGRLATGFLLDKVHGRFVGAVMFSVPVVGITALIGWPTSVLSSEIAAVSVGLTLGAEMDCFAYMTSRYYGMRNFGLIYGTLAGFFSAGAGLGPLIAAWTFDLTHGYRFFLVALIPMMLTVSAIFLTLSPYPSVQVQPGTR